MKVVLVQPKVNFQRASYWEPLGIGYIAAFLKEHVPRIQVEVYSGAFDSDETIVKACADADIVGFGCTSPQMKHALELARRIQLLNHGVYTVFGGYHPTALPFETHNNPVVDKVIMAEGEEGMLATVKGNRMNVYVSKRLPFQYLPDPDREVIHNERYIEVAEREAGERITSVQSVRGCPFRCTPCSNILMHGTKIREREPESTVREMQLIRINYELDFIKFCDATFNTNVNKVLAFCSAMKKLSKVKEKWWGCNIHPSLTTRGMFGKMAKSGCREIWVGVESGSPRILKELNKGTTVAIVKKAFKWAKLEGLLTRAYFLIGSPSEDESDIKKTEKLAEEIEADIYGFTILCPYPGTPFYDSAKYKDVDWSLADEYSNKFYRNKAFSNEELWEIRESLAEKFKEKMCWKLKEHEN